MVIIDFWTEYKGSIRDWNSVFREELRLRRQRRRLKFWQQKQFTDRVMFVYADYKRSDPESKVSFIGIDRASISGVEPKSGEPYMVIFKP